MRRQRLDFAHPQPSVKLKVSPLGTLLLVAAVAFAATMVERYLEVAGQIEAAETRIGRLARATQPERTISASREKVAEEVRRVNRSAAQLTIPWEDLFRTVESAADRSIALLALQPSFAKRELRISGEADEYAAVLQYIERLGTDGALSDVRLVSHEVVSRPNARGIRFELSAIWKAGMSGGAGAPVSGDATREGLQAADRTMIVSRRNVHEAAP